MLTILVAKRFRFSFDDNMLNSSLYCVKSYIYLLVGYRDKIMKRALSNTPRLEILGLK